MSQVYGAGGKTTPKKGRLGTGSYYPEGTPLYRHPGNVFPGIKVVRPDFHETKFGDPSRAGIATVVGQDRTQAQPILPNQAFYSTATLMKLPPMVVGSSNDANNLQPVAPQRANLVMPHERNTNSASGTKKKPATFRTAFGAGKTMPNDTAFERRPNVNYKHTVRALPRPAVEAVKRVAIERTFARAHNPLPVSGGVNPRQQHRTPPPSFVSRGNHWNDPHNSFVGGHTTIAGMGTGRWNTVKKGVINVSV